MMNRMYRLFFWIIALVTTAVIAGRPACADELARSQFLTHMLDPNNQQDWVSPFVQEFVEALGGYATSVFNVLATQVYQVVIYVFMIWIVLQCLYLMLGLQSLQKILVAIVQRAFVFMIVSGFLLASHNMSYWTSFVDNPMKMTVNISESVMQASGAALPTTVIVSQSPVAQYTAQLAGDMEQSLKAGVEIGFVIAIGQNWPGLLTASIVAFLAAILSLFGGLLISVVYGMSIIYFAFFLLDVVIKIYILSSLAPFFIGFFLIKPTRGYAIAAFQQLLGSFVSLISASLVLGVMTNLLTWIGSALSTSVTGAGTGGVWQVWQNVFSAIISNPNNLTLISFGSAAYWEILVIGVLTVSITKKINDMFQGILSSSHFSGAASAFMPVVSKGVEASLGFGGLVAGAALGQAYRQRLPGMNSVQQNFGQAGSTMSQTYTNARSAPRKLIVRTMERSRVGKDALTRARAVRDWFS